MNALRTCAVIPVYNHREAVAAVVAALRLQSLPVILVDDGSDAACAFVLDTLATEPDVHWCACKKIKARVGAMMAGLREARRMGFSHALQIDADGQHDTDDIPRFLTLSAAHPYAVICGCPVYDASVPKGRLYGRYATHVWVWINTLSLSIRDSMCGFRVYPLSAVVELIDGVHMGRRMDFDIEILVRLYWRDIGIVSLPTRVTYPADGISHFRVLRDNVLIACMHARLFCGMLLRLPMLLWRKVSP